MRGRGFRHLLLVSGEHPRVTPPEYFGSILEALREERVNWEAVADDRLLNWSLDDVLRVEEEEDV